MRLPSSLLAGLMWFDPDRADALSNIRHLAQDRDGTHCHCQASCDMTHQSKPQTLSFTEHIISVILHVICNL